MEFKIDKDTLADATQVVGSAAHKKSVVEALESICIIAAKGYLRFVATDGMTTIDLSVPAEIVREGSVCINADKLVGLAKNMDSGEVSFSLLPNKVTMQIIEAEGSLTELLVLDSGMFPLPKHVENMSRCNVNSDALSEMMRKSSKFVFGDERRVALTGINIQFDSESGVMKTVSTNSFQMFSSKSVAEGDGSFNIVMPMHASQIIEKLLKDIEADSTTIMFNDDIISLDIGGVSVTSKLFDAPYPDLSHIFAMERNRSFSFVKADFVKFLRRASVLSKQDAVPELNITVSKDKLIMSSTNNKSEKVDGSIACESDLVNDYYFSLNINQVQSTIALIQSKSVIVEFGMNEDEVPNFVGAFLRDDAQKEDMYIIMPLLNKARK